MTRSKSLAPIEDGVADALVLSKALTATSRRAANSITPDACPLHDPQIVDLARHVLGDALGPPRTGSEPFPLVIWKGGAEHVGLPVWILGGQVVPKGTPGAAMRRSPGVRFTGSINGFCEMLGHRAGVVVPKGKGWVVEPTTNRDGQRTNDSTLYMHAVFLDADDCGDWDQTLGELGRLGVAHVAYRSGGHLPETPKWRVAIPLATAQPVQNDAQRTAWKRLYHRCRVLVGALGGLRGVGFDPRTDAPSIPWFLCERRSAEDPVREHIFHPGASLDLTALAMSLPTVADVEEEPRSTRSTSSDASSRDTMDETRLDEIVSAIAAVTGAVPRGRRDLYLALPGALLDRGVHPDDVVTICTEVSAAYPRKHPDKHRDNVHNARTTVTKWSSGDPSYTRIGTLQATHPEVAAAIDRVMPDPVRTAIAEAVSMVAAEPAVTARAELPHEGIPIPEMPPSPPTSGERRTRKDVEVAALRRRLAKIAEEKSSYKNKETAAAAEMLRVVLSGRRIESFDARVRDEATKKLFDLVGFEVGVDPDDEGISFDATLDALGMLGDVSTETYHVGATAHATGVERRKVWDAAAPNRLKKLNEKKSLQHVETQNRVEARRKALARRR